MEIDIVVDATNWIEFGFEIADYAEKNEIINLSLSSWEQYGMSWKWTHTLLGDEQQEAEALWQVISKYKWELSVLISDSDK
jgi:hypothetical protein